MGNATRVSGAASNGRGVSSRRRGVAMFYVLATLTVFLGFCSLAVDFGRVQVAKTEIRRAADAAARAGAANLVAGNVQSSAVITNVDNAAVQMASQNRVDGLPMALTSKNITIGIWNSNTHTFSQSGTADNISTFNAVQVVAQRTKANGNPIPLLFGMVLGAKTCDVSATSVAALVSVSGPQHVFVSAHGDPWLAGEPAGTQGSVPDNGYVNRTHPWKYDLANPGAVATAGANEQSSGSYSPPTDPTKNVSTDYTTGQPYGSPSELVLNVQPGSMIQVSIPKDSNNLASNDGFLTGGSVNYSADGSNNGSYAYYSDDAANPSLSQGTQTTSGSEHGISNIIAPINSVIGVFLDQKGSTQGADSESAPAGVDYSVTANRDQTTVEPKLNQSFYVGDGQTGSGQTQTIVVPAKTYALFLGTMDGHEWSNNQGGYHATITQFSIQLVK